MTKEVVLKLVLDRTSGFLPDAVFSVTVSSIHPWLKLWFEPAEMVTVAEDLVVSSLAGQTWTNIPVNPEEFWARTRSEDPPVLGIRLQFIIVPGYEYIKLAWVIRPCTLHPPPIFLLSSKRDKIRLENLVFYHLGINQDSNPIFVQNYDLDPLNKPESSALRSQQKDEKFCIVSLILDTFPCSCKDNLTLL